MDTAEALTALRAEAACLTDAITAFTDTHWRRPTRCHPWNAAAVCAHITATLARLDPMLDQPPPPAATVSAADYYRGDTRYAPDTTTARLDEATAAAAAGGPAVATAFEHTWRTVADRCADTEPDRLVTTRHGDTMRLDHYLTTRVLELAVHGIDLADAVETDRWTSPHATAHLTDLLAAAPAALPWTPLTFIAKATGRDPIHPGDRAMAEAAGARWLTFA